MGPKQDYTPNLFIINKIIIKLFYNTTDGKLEIISQQAFKENLFGSLHHPRVDILVGYPTYRTELVLFWPSLCGFQTGNRHLLWDREGGAGRMSQLMRLLSSACLPRGARTILTATARRAGQLLTVGSKSSTGPVREPSRPWLRKLKEQFENSSQL